MLTHFADLMAQNNPGSVWTYNNNPQKSGWNTGKLKNLKQFIIDSTQVTGLMVIHNGQVVFEYGDVQENSYIASCRKSILAMLYGKPVLKGQINLNSTLRSLNIDDLGGLLDIEKQATVRDVLSARSGVFHKASNPGDYLEFAPKRGSVKPGDFWLYSNWDFNVAGTIFEKQTGRSIYESLDQELAIPLKMQDWKKEIQRKYGDSTSSIHPAYHMWFSTRDMARLGLLMLNKGKWDDKYIIDSNWVNEMVKPRTQFTEVNEHIPAYKGSDYYFGYGYYWWLWQNVTDKRFEGGYSALGAIGQTISVFPKTKTVVVYKTKDTYDRETPYAARYRLIRLAVQCLDTD
ncbi:serine hydrolase [Pedobacter sp. HMWF019]|uniref:serine hydrolase domain-containing protein n=1 Tax=Pedobacter sp. HMWF019 TaxID=2056856 RepID=UPI001304F1F2|nr:serine hydrolase [Pedobacter sp. HMWF019]